MPRHYTRYRQFSLEEVLPRIGQGPWIVIVDGQRIKVRMSGTRMLLFGKTQQCACCGAIGHHFWLEKSGKFPPHLNLYAINRYGHFTMLTMDHIVPRSKGGETVAENVQVLCTKCNAKKKNDVLTIKQLQERVGIQC